MDSPRESSQGRSVRQPVLLGLFTGVAVGVGYLLAGVPGVELMTLVTALAGLALGGRRGAVVGALAALVYSVGSPYGVPLPPILAAQVLGMAGAGVIGGVLAAALRRAGTRRRGVLAAVTAGVAAAVFYDVVTNLAIALAYATPLAAVAAMAATMFLVHVAVNAVVFALVVPTVAPRLQNLGRGSLVGRGTATCVAVALALVWPAASRGQVPAATDTTMVPAATDTTMVPAPADTATVPAPPAERRVQLGEQRPEPGPHAAFGWVRPLWQPFAPDPVTGLNWYSPRVVAAEAGVGGPTVVFGEAGTTPMPRVEVDGVPWNLGHAMVDDPWLVPREGLDLTADQWYVPAAGGTAGRLRLDMRDPDPDKAISGYRGVKGRHESYMRSFHVLTPRSTWRIGFFYEEVIDREAYNYTQLPDEVFRPTDDYYPGHASVRQGRTRIERRTEGDGYLRVDAVTARKTRDHLPAWQARHAEVWERRVGVTWGSRSGNTAWRTVLHWGDRDLQWGPKPSPTATLVTSRKLEVRREGVVVDLWRSAAPALAVPDSGAGQMPLSAKAPDPDSWRRRGPGLRLAVGSWQVADSGDTLATLPDTGGPLHGRGQEVRATGAVGGGLFGGRWRLDLGGAWDSRAGGAPVAVLTAGDDRDSPRWQLTLAGDGRAPRSDELLTPEVRNGGTSGVLVILPNSSLRRERMLRAGLVLRARLLGNDLALDAGARRLEDGITWVPQTGAVDTGELRNDLEMDSARVTASLFRQGRLLGWARALVEATWQNFDERQGRAAFLPPETSLRVHLFWENHFFREDGILQLGLISTVRGEFDDPWDVSRGTHLPRRTVHDALIGFRLVGAHLSLAIKNLTGDRVQLSRSTWSAGQEIDLRLRWNFRY